MIHVIDVGNAASQAVARKLGSRNRGRGQLPAPYEAVDHRRLGADARGVARAPLTGYSPGAAVPENNRVPSGLMTPVAIAMCG